MKDGKAGHMKYPKITAPKLMDHSDSHDVKVTSGANIKKQVPGLNQSIVPLIPDHRR